MVSLVPLVCNAIEPDLTLNTWDRNPFSNKDHTGYLDIVLIEAFKRIGLSIDIDHKPLERSITDANNGIGDGEFIRVAGVSALYPNLIRVPEKLFDMEFVAFTKKNNIVINGWNSLNPYDVGIVIGWKILEQNIQNVRARSDVVDEESLFKMLVAGRVDVVVYSRYFGLVALKNMGLKGILIKDPPLAVEPMYLYLHKKHEGIIPDLVKSLKSMKRDGTFSKIKKRYLD